MAEIKNVLIVGIGAIGSIYANIISRYDSSSLRILVDECRLRRYSSCPHVFNGNELKLNYVLPSETSFKADLIIIATKYSGFKDAICNIKNFVNKDTIILSLLNGISSEEEIASVYGWKNVLHSYFIGHSAMRNGNIITHDGVGTIVYGVIDSMKTDKSNVDKLQKYFEKLGIDYKLPDDIQYSMWAKFALNVCVNQTSAILKMTFGQMQQNKNFVSLMEKIIDEVTNIAEVVGVKGAQNLKNDVWADFNRMIPEGKTSMLQDVDSQRKTEVEMFAGQIVKLGKKYDVKTPYNCVMKDFIEIIEESFD